MEIIIMQSFCSIPEQKYKMVKKTHKSEIIPRKGDYISDLAFKEPKKVEKVIINYNTDKCYVDVPFYKTAYSTKEEINMYQGHGWSILEER